MSDAGKSAEDRFVEAMRELTTITTADDEPYLVRCVVEAFADAVCGGHLAMGKPGFDPKADHRRRCRARLLKRVMGGEGRER
jgi:hypothetical protein